MWVVVGSLPIIRYRFCAVRCGHIIYNRLVRTHMHMHMCIRTHMHMHMRMHMSLVSLSERRGAGAGAVPCNPTVVFSTAALLPWVGKAGRRVRVQAGAAGGEDQNDRPGEVWRDVKVESGPSSAAHHGSAEARGTAPEQRTQRGDCTVSPTEYLSLPCALQYRSWAWGTISERALKLNRDLIR